MAPITYLVIFKTGRHEIVYAGGLEDATILAKAEQIKKGNKHTIMSVFKVEDAEVEYSILEE